MLQGRQAAIARAVAGPLQAGGPPRPVSAPVQWASSFAPFICGPFICARCSRVVARGPATRARAPWATQAPSSPVGQRLGPGRSVRFPCLFVASIVIVLHPVPTFVHVYVGNDLTPF